MILYLFGQICKKKKQNLMQNSLLRRSFAGVCVCVRNLWAHVCVGAFFRCVCVLASAQIAHEMWPLEKFPVHILLFELQSIIFRYQIHPNRCIVVDDMGPWQPATDAGMKEKIRVCAHTNTLAYPPWEFAESAGLIMQLSPGSSAAAKKVSLFLKDVWRRLSGFLSSFFFHTQRRSIDSKQKQRKSHTVYVRQRRGEAIKHWI